MSSITLNVPSSDDYFVWFEFIESSISKLCSVENLIVDFNDVKFLDPDDFVVLACLIESFVELGAKVNFRGGTDSFNAHLENIKFKQYWTPNFNRKRFTTSRNDTTLCLWKINKEQIYEYSKYAKEYFRDRFMSDKDLHPLQSNLDEVFNNIFDHSQSPIGGYVMIQFYPRNNKLSFAVCDFGKGIPYLINKFLKEKKMPQIPDSQAINMAVNEGFSIMSTPRNRGMGLHYLITLTENSNGLLRITSNKGYLQKISNNFFETENFDFNFQGTLIKVEVDLNTFENFDDQLELFEF